MLSQTPNNALPRNDIEFDQAHMKPNLIQFHHTKNNQSYGTLNNSAERGRLEEELKVRDNDVSYFIQVGKKLKISSKFVMILDL